MKTALDKYKGIHPGLILEHELKKRHIKKNHFAQAVDQKRQTLNAITKGRRNLPVELSFKIDRELGYDDGTMLIMQTYYEIENHQKNERSATAFTLGELRKGLFWDTDINKLDWEKHAIAIIKRVFERGNEEEKEYIISHYGQKRVQNILGTDPRHLLRKESAPIP